MRADATSTSRRAPPGPRGHGWTPRALPSLETRARTLEQASNQGLAALNIWPTMRGVSSQHSTLSRRDRTLYAQLAGRSVWARDTQAGRFSLTSDEQGGGLPCWY